MTVQEIVAAVFVGAGVFWLFIGGVGIVRFPDVYSRLHPAGKADTLGASLTILGLAIYQGVELLSVKLFLVQFFILLANPTAAHAIGRAAKRAGLRPWKSGDDS